MDFFIIKISFVASKLFYNEPNLISNANKRQFYCDIINLVCMSFKGLII